MTTEETPTSPEGDGGIEITYDPVEAAAAMDLLIDPERHRVVPDGPWIRRVREEINRESLFIYHNLQTGMFVLADWIVRGKVAQELLTFSAPPGHHPPDLPSMEALRFRLVMHDQASKRMREAMHEAQWARREARRRNDDERAAAVKWLQKKGMVEAAARVARSPWFGKDDDMTDELSKLAAGSIITH